MPVEYPENDWTRMIERAARANESGVGAGVASAEPRPTVASASLGREIQDRPEITAEERHELDRRAIELGIMPAPEGDEGPYATMEDALRAAGADDVRAAALATQMEPAPTEDPTLRPRRRGPSFDGRPEARVQIIETPRFPDFTKVQGLDLQKGVAYLDSMEFAVPPEALRKMRQYVVQLAHAAVQAKLQEAMGLFAPEIPNGQGETSTGA